VLAGRELGENDRAIFCAALFENASLKRQGGRDLRTCQTQTHTTPRSRVSAIQRSQFYPSETWTPEIFSLKIGQEHRFARMKTHNDNSETNEETPSVL
jgi:hypothetical protein